MSDDLEIMKTRPHFLLLATALLAVATSLAAVAASGPAPADLVFAEHDGLVAFEAEHFVKQELTEKRAWHLTTAALRAGLAPDTDGTHVLGASGGAYLEILPDTRWSHDQPLVLGENLSPDPGKMAVLTYRVHFATPGRYHVWARVRSSNGEDNGMHFGIDGQWPASGRQWQTIKKNAWGWDSRQRTESVHVGVPGLLFLDVPAAGEHTIHVSMREDGVELDKLLLTSDSKYTPEDTGPAPKLKSGQLPAAYPVPAGYKESPALTPLAPKPPPPVAAAIPFDPAPIVPADLLFSERDGLAAFEAEHFAKQELTKKRAWFLTTATQRTTLTPDTDGTHVAGASGGAYLEALPDTRWTRAEPIVQKENLAENPGVLAVLSYRVHFTTPGRYHVWARIYSTGSEDNSLHFGLDGRWPDSGRAWQTVKKNAWIWDSRQRTEAQPDGVPGQLYLDVATAGEHMVMICLREDGVELDKIVLARDPGYVPAENGPAPQVRQGQLPAAFAIPANYQEAPAPTRQQPRTKPAPRAPDEPGTVSGVSLTLEGTGYYADRNRWAAIDPSENKEAAVKFPAPVAAGRYRVTLHAVGESDGNSSYEVLLGGRPVGTFTCPPSKETFEEGPAFTKTWPDVAVSPGALVEVRARIASNDGREFSRARWSKIVFSPAGPDSTAKPAAIPQR